MHRVLGCLLLFPLLVLGGTSVEAREPPPCDDAKVKDTLREILRTTWQIEVVTDLRSSKPERWCLAEDIGLPYPGLGGSYVDVTYTVEWINEQEGRFWVQIKSQRRTLGRLANNGGLRAPPRLPGSADLLWKISCSV